MGSVQYLGLEFQCFQSKTFDAARVLGQKIFFTKMKKKKIFYRNIHCKNQDFYEKSRHAYSLVSRDFVPKSRFAIMSYSEITQQKYTYQRRLLDFSMHHGN